MSFLSIHSPGVQLYTDAIHIERLLQKRVERLVEALEHVMPEGSRFDPCFHYEASQVHLDLKVNDAGKPHPLPLASYLASGARQVHDRYFAAFRQERGFERQSGDGSWLEVNAAVHAIEATGGEVWFHSGTSYEQRLEAIDPDFVRLARTWDDGFMHVEGALVVGLKVLPALQEEDAHSVLMSVNAIGEPYLAEVSGHQLEGIRIGRTRVSFQYLRDDNGVCEVAAGSLVMH